MYRRRAIVLNVASSVDRLADVLDRVHTYFSRSPAQKGLDTIVEVTSGTDSYVRFLADDLAVGQAESTMVLAVLAAVSLGWKPLLRHDRGDPIDIVNRFLLAMVPWRVGEGDGSQGNYDFLLANLVTAATTYGYLLSGPARDHVVSTLLSQRGPVDPEQLTVNHGPGGVISYAETENHVLQIETGRYLTNQIIGFDNNRAGVTAFLLEKLQGFLQNDFSEYNARPYQGHSVRSITALYDLGQDAAIRNAAQLVLDYLTVKFAVSSNCLRRHTPFRRRREHTWDPGLCDDAESSRLLALTGMGRLFRAAYPGSDLKPLEPFVAVPAVLTAYRPPLIARNLVMMNSHKQYYQRFKHSGLELFYSTPEFLITAGGIRVGSALGDDFAHLEDISVPLATTLMPSEGAVDVRDVIRFEGNNTDEMKVNTGVLPGFACGLNLDVPVRYAPANDPRILDPTMGVVNATRLSSPEGHYFAASVKTDWPQAVGEGGWLVAIPAIEMSFDMFVKNVLEGGGTMDMIETTGVNRLSIAPFPLIAFTPAGDRGNLQRWPIRGLQGQWYDASTWPLATGDVMNSEGHSGVIHVDHPIVPYMTSGQRRALRITPVISVRQEAARRGIDLNGGVSRMLDGLRGQGVRTVGSLRLALEVLSRRLTLDMRDLNRPVRIAPHFTAREVAYMLGRGLTGDISVRGEAAQKQVDVTRGLRMTLSELVERGVHPRGSVTRAFEALSRRPSPTGPVSIRACFNHDRLMGATEFRISTLLHGG